VLAIFAFFVSSFMLPHIVYGTAPMT
jgi:hypothetical protein